MPVISTHCFANHRDGVGKSTLTYQLSAAYAVAHPEYNVLVIDATRSGDVSEMLLGEVDEWRRGQPTLRCLVALANTTQLFLQALAASSGKGNHFKTFTRSKPYTNSIPLTKTMQDMTPDNAKAIIEYGKQDEETQSATCIEVEDFAIPLKHVNSRLPANLFLCPSGLDIEQPVLFSQSQRSDILSVLNSCFRQAQGSWKVFIDTDAPLPRETTDVYTLLSLGISDFVCIPLRADTADWNRVSCLLQDIRLLRRSGEARVKVQMVMWTGLTIKFNRECNFDCPGSSDTCTFTPTKAEQDVIRCLNKLVFKEAQRYPDLFVHTSTSQTNEKAFGSRCSLCVRNFSVVGIASKDVGVPIACLSEGIVQGTHMTYTLNDNMINRCRENLNELVKAVHGSNALVSSKLLTSQQQKNLDEMRLRRKLSGKFWKLKHNFNPTREGKKGPSKALLVGVATTAPRSLRPHNTARFKIHNTRYKYPLRDRTLQSKNLSLCAFKSELHIVDARHVEFGRNSIMHIPHRINSF